VEVTGGGRYYSAMSPSHDGTRIAFTAEDGMNPPDVFVSDTDTFNSRRPTDLNPGIADLMLGSQRVERWRSRADGEEIEGVLTLPVGYEDGEPVPLGPRYPRRPFRSLLGPVPRHSGCLPCAGLRGPGFRGPAAQLPRIDRLR